MNDQEHIDWLRQTWMEERDRADALHAALHPLHEQQMRDGSCGCTLLHSCPASRALHKHELWRGSLVRSAHAVR